MDGAGVYRTDDLGDHWDAAGGANFGTATSLFLSHAPALGGGNLTTVNAKLAVRPDAPGDTVYAALTIHLDGCRVACIDYSRIFRSVDAGRNWSAPLTPGTCEGPNVALELGGACNNGVDRQFGTHPFGEGDLFLALAADHAAGIVYVGGDSQPAADVGGDGAWGGGDDVISTARPNSSGATNYTARIFRCDFTAASCSSITDNGTDDHSTPHADSRAMAVNVLGELVLTSDGGIYRMKDPTQTNAAVLTTWHSYNGDVGKAIFVGEQHSCDYDHVKPTQRQLMAIGAFHLPERQDHAAVVTRPDYPGHSLRPLHQD